MDKKIKAEGENINGLIELVCKGDSQAFSRLVEMYDPMLKKILFSYKSEDMTKEDVEDLGQEELIAFYRAALNFNLKQEDVEFGLYAKICVTNSMISYKRAARKKSNEVSYLREEDLSNLSDPNDEPSKQFEQKESEMLLGKQIEETLSQYENEVWGFYVNGYSTKEIASLLRSSEKSIDNAIFRIRRKLKTLLKFDI